MGCAGSGVSGVVGEVSGVTFETSKGIVLFSDPEKAGCAAPKISVDQGGAEATWRGRAP